MKSAPVRGSGATKSPMDLWLPVIPAFAISYNGLFAAAAAAGAPMNNGIVTATEILIIAVAIGLSLYRDGVRREDTPSFLFLGTIVGVALLGSILFERPMIEGVRNVLIIVAFTMLGTRFDEPMLRRAFVLSCAVAVGVLLIEINNVETYAAIFRPADYLSKTRGYAINEFDDIGLAAGTVQYEGRFSFGMYSGPRTSSIFLEQVGINCFSIVSMVYLCTMWPRLPIPQRILTLATVILIVVTNNARMSAILAPMFLVGYFVFPRLPRYWAALIPVLSLAATFTIFAFARARYGDDLIGRIATTYRVLNSMSAGDLILGAPALIARTGDTGYGFVIASMGLIGAMAYWAYLTIIVPQNSPTARRAAWAASVYIYVWLLVGGTGTFSMKSAPLLWLLLGYLRATNMPAPASTNRLKAGFAPRRPDMLRGATG